jgi:hypothetical protein
MTIHEAVHNLHIFNNNHTHSQKRRGGGDNGGLKVLFISTDDREMKDRIEDNDYVAMTAVLVQNYIMRHGYDFLKMTGNSTGLVDRVRERYPVENVGGQGETKYGPSAFHPGLMQFRASSWAKLPHIWHAITGIHMFIHMYSYMYIYITTHICFYVYL